MDEHKHNETNAEVTGVWAYVLLAFSVVGMGWTAVTVWNYISAMMH
jgi:hypothetical protein